MGGTRREKEVMSVLNLCPHTRERKTNVRTDTHLNTFLTATRPATDKTLRLSPTSTIIFLVLSLVEVSMGCSRVLVLSLRKERESTESEETKRLTVKRIHLM